MTDQEIFNGIARKDNQTFLYLYNEFQASILSMVRKNSGTPEQARDVFQEGLLALWSNIVKEKFELKPGAKISTYLYALCRNIWISKLRKNKVLFSLDNSNIEIADEVDELQEEHERIQTLETQFQKLGQTCQKLLKLFYYEKRKLRDIAQQLDLTEQTAKNNKYRCMQKLRAFYQA